MSISGSGRFSGRMTLLGTGTSVGVPVIGCDCEVCTSTNPRNTRTRTGVFVSAPDGNFLIDTPPELRVQLIREQIGLVEAVVYTHAHADHILGLDDLRIFGYRLKGPVQLYCEEHVEAHLRATFSYAFQEPVPGRPQHSRPNLAFNQISEDPFSLLGLTITPIRMIHGALPVLGYRINDVAFCTDCSEIPGSSLALLEGLDVLIIDALWYEPHPTHFNVAQALEVIERVRPRRAYLTHVSHRLDYDETNARLPSHVELAYDGLQIPL
ncbi:MBL fold metallo-hydrolase [Maioricimonas sp. JC845]|uniref:MBL fold metallo-hydrolase n=1 Tax=Maioricimonas sp. JC845 TaxID=3232138 RepID=UPI003459E140